MQTRLFHAIVVAGGTLVAAAAAACGAGVDPVCDPAAASDMDLDPTQGAALITAQAAAADSVHAPCTPSKVEAWPPTKC